MRGRGFAVQASSSLRFSATHANPGGRAGPGPRRSRLPRRLHGSVDVGVFALVLRQASAGGRKTPGTQDSPAGSRGSSGPQTSQANDRRGGKQRSRETSCPQARTLHGGGWPRWPGTPGPV